MLTADGRVAHVLWIGTRRIRPASHPRPELVNPVRIKAHAFADGLPRRDLQVSPGHGIAVGDHLIPAGLLVNGVSIVQEAVEQVAYLHVELAQHDLLLAEGLAAESYLDCGDRGVFESAGGPVTLFPSFGVSAAALAHEAACLPFAVTGPLLEATRAKLTARAQPPGPKAEDVRLAG